MGGGGGEGGMTHSTVPNGIFPWQIIQIHFARGMSAASRDTHAVELKPERKRRR